MPNETFYICVLIYVRILRMYTYSCSFFILGKQYKKKDEYIHTREVNKKKISTSLRALRGGTSQLELDN